MLHCSNFINTKIASVIGMINITNSNSLEAAKDVVFLV